MDKLHAAALAEVVKRLKADPGVAALVADRVYGPGDEPQTEPVEDGADPPPEPVIKLPCVVVTKGKAWGKPPGPKQLAQVDARVESRAAEQKVLHLLLVAVAGALNGAVGSPLAGFRNAVLSHTPPEEDADDGTYRSRRDVYGLFVSPPAPTA